MLLDNLQYAALQIAIDEVLILINRYLVPAAQNDDNIAAHQFLGEGSLEQLFSTIAGHVFRQKGKLPALGDFIPRRRR